MSDSVTTSPLLEPGTNLDQYKVIRKIGAGGMAEVYLAQDVPLGREVAIKVMNPKLLCYGRLKEQFFTEVRTMAKFSHPNITTIFGVGEVRGTPYAALEYLDGQTLRARMTCGLSVEESMRIGIPVALALKELHSQRILHRDIKPENIIVLKDGTSRLADFGLAEAFGASRRIRAVDNRERANDKTPFDLQRGAESSRYEPISGTPMYMSPEQWMQEPLSGAADIWALGIILAELLSMRLPIHGIELYALRAMVCSKLPFPSFEFLSGVPASLKIMIMRCLLKDPGRRPSAAEVAGLLGELTGRNPQHELTMMELTKSKEELRLANKRLRVLATTDPLTGLYNRRRCLDILEGEISRVARGNQSLSLIMVDVDHFKHVNDTYGHGVGDAILVEISRRLKNACRPHDAVCRWGGEELLIICPHTDSKQALAAAKRLCAILSEHPFDIPSLPPVSITASMGAASTDVFPNLNGEELIDCADEALYQAKHSGRNCVRASSVPAPLVMGI